MKFFSLIILLLLTSCSKNSSIYDTRFMLGTLVTIKINDHGSTELLNKCFDILTLIEDKMSTSITDNDISRINKYAGEKAIKVSDDTAYVINRGLYYSKISNGRFDISIGPLVNLWGVGNGNAHVPEKQDIEKALLNVDYRKIIQNKNLVYLEENMSIDLGAIAKGFAADKVADLLLKSGVKSAIINLGGNIKILGEKYENTPFRVGIQNPFNSENDYPGILSITDKSIVSSGDYERFFIENGKRFHHILDTTTGYPVETEVSSVTVITQSSMSADALSTIFFSMEIDKGFELADNLGNIELIYITRDYKIYISKELENKFELTDSTFSLVLK